MFDLLAAERAAEEMGAAVTRCIEAEYGTFDEFEAELERELAGQVAMTADELMERLLRGRPNDD